MTYVRFHNEFESLVKAAILSELKGYKPGYEITPENCVDTNDFRLKKLLLDWEWAYDAPKDIEKLKSEIELAKRFRAFDKHLLLIKIIIQALKHGHNYIHYKMSPEAKIFLERANRIRLEIQRLVNSIQLFEVGNSLIGELHSKNEVHDKVALMLSRKHPNHTIILVSSDKDIITKNGELIISNRSLRKIREPEIPELDKTPELILQRINKRLTVHNMPVKTQADNKNKLTNYF